MKTTGKVWLEPEHLSMLWSFTVKELRAFCRAVYGGHLPRAYRKADIIKVLRTHDDWSDGMTVVFHGKPSRSLRLGRSTGPLHNSNPSALPLQAD